MFSGTKADFGLLEIRPQANASTIELVVSAFYSGNGWSFIAKNRSKLIEALLP